MTANEKAREQFDQAIREAMDTASSADPSVVAAEVLKGLTARQKDVALAVTLPPYVRVMMSRYGWKVRNRAIRQATTADRVRSWYSQQLSVSLFVGDQWKFLGDCTANDLHEAARSRYEKAALTHREGDRWTKVAIFMEEYQRETVADISESELQKLMEES